MWPDRRLLDLFGIEHPILLAPMAGAMNVELAVAVAEGGGLAALPCAMLSAEQVHEQVTAFRARVQAPINLNFFNHTPPVPNNAREAAWRERLAPYYRELGIDPNAPVPSANRRPFDAEMLDAVRDVEPEVISFHYGMPKGDLLKAVKSLPAKLLCSATTVAEAKAVEEQGAHAVIAQGLEAGGHRGTFLDEDLGTQVGTFALVPLIADAVRIPVIAAGGIGDGRGVAASLALGAAGALIGTAYLFTPEAKIAPPFREALKAADAETAITNVFSGRLARGLSNRFIREVGPIAAEAPVFPLAAAAGAPLRAAAEKQGSSDFTPMWAGQAVALGRTMGAAELTRQLAAEALDRLRQLAPR